MLRKKKIDRTLDGNDVLDMVYGELREIADITREQFSRLAHLSRDGDTYTVRLDLPEGSDVVTVHVSGDMASITLPRTWRLS